jgi:hypothetical protein
LISDEGKITEKIRYNDIHKTCLCIKFLIWGFGGEGCSPATLRHDRARERKYWIHNVSRASEEEGEFRIQFGRLKNETQIFSNIIE